MHALALATRSCRCAGLRFPASTLPIRSRALPASSPHFFVSLHTSSSVARAAVMSPNTRSGAQKTNGDYEDTVAHPSTHQHGTGTAGKHDWKQRPPYSVHDSDEAFDAKLEASCHCGRVQYQLSRDEPLASKICHCTTCQTQHGAPFQWAAIFHKTDINFSNGHHNLEWYDPSTKSLEHSLPCKVRCNFCHSPIMDEGRNMILLYPSLIKFQNDEQKRKFAPNCHMFYKERAMDFKDGLKKWTGINDNSELMDE